MCKAELWCVPVHACMSAPLTVCVLPDPNLPVPAAYGLNKGEGDGSPMTLVMAGAQGCRIGGAGELPGLGQGGPDDPLNPANIPLPGEVPMLPPGSPSQGVDGTPPHAAKLLSIPLPGEAATVGLEGVPGLGGEGTDVPSAITVHLPARWRVARDADGHVYFYHVKTRITQWEPPTILTPGLASDSSSSSSSSSDSDSSSTTDVSHPPPLLSMLPVGMSGRSTRQPWGPGITPSCLQGPDSHSLTHFTHK